MDIDRKGIESPFADEFLNPHDQLLSTSDGKSGDNNLALMGFRMEKEFQRFLLHDFPIGFVQAVAVGRLKYQHIAGRRGLRVTEDWHIRTAKISAKKHGGRIAACRIFHSNSRRSQDMAGVVKRSGHAWGNLKHIPVSCSLESANKLAHIIGIIERPDTGLSLPPFLLIDVPTITRLHTSRVFEHECCQIGGRSGEVYLSGESMLLEHR